MDDYRNKLGSLADKLKKEAPETPVQEVLPVKAAAPQEPKCSSITASPKAC